MLPGDPLSPHDRKGHGLFGLVRSVGSFGGGEMEQVKEVEATGERRGEDG